MKKLLIVGSTGVIGKKVVELMTNDYEIIEINRSSGDYQVDMQDANAVEKVFEKIGNFEGLISASGYGKWASMDDMSTQDYHDGLNSKLMGQVNLVTVGRKYAKSDAAFILSSGILAQHPVAGSTSLSMINAGIEAFVAAAALELGDTKINAVSPTFAKETMELMGMDSSTGTPAAEIAQLYKQALEGGKTGIVYRA